MANSVIDRMSQPDGAVHRGDGKRVFLHSLRLLHTGLARTTRHIAEKEAGGCLGTGITPALSARLDGAAVSCRASACSAKRILGRKPKLAIVISGLRDAE